MPIALGVVLYAPNRKRKMNSDELRKIVEDDQRHNQAVTELRIEHARFKMALESIAINTCCDKCQEAARVAQSALNRGEKR